jgi:hypothetical protein
MIRIIGDSGYVDILRSYQIIVDGRAVGEIRNGGQVEFDVPPGRHQIHLELNWCRSNVVDFEANRGVIQFECGSNIRGWKSLIALLYVTFLRDQYLWLRKADEPWA